MADETDLLNDALSQFGGSSITSISDGSINANHCQRFYPPLRRALIRMHHWNFALQWVQLAQDVTPPVAMWAYAYTLPAECLKVVNYGGSATAVSSLSLIYPDSGIRVVVRYKIEGRKLVSNDGTVYIQYLRDVTNPDEWDGMFYQVMASWLASKLCMAITKDVKLSTGLLGQARDILLPIATAVDGQEGSVEPYVVDDLLWGR
jgi:hypothetical protein